tara:strand:- start:783 stop:941 length:159 start_codon:yes stop_codon:yes gene_type:complete
LSVLANIKGLVHEFFSGLALELDDFYIKGQNSLVMVVATTVVVFARKKKKAF